MAGAEFYITAIGEVTIEGECVRAEFRSGRKAIVLRGSVNTLMRALELGQRAVAERPEAEVIPLPKHG